MDRKESKFTKVPLLQDSDYVRAFGQNSNIAISKPDLFKQIKDETQIFIYPTIEQLQAANLVADPDWPIYVRVEETEYRLYKITSFAAGGDDISLNNGTTATFQGEYYINIETNAATPQEILDAQINDKIVTPLGASGTILRTFDTVLDLAGSSLEIGDNISTKGANAIGDGGEGNFIVEAPSGTPDSYSRVLLANGNHAVLQPVNGKCNSKQFGAKGDGVSDDTAAIRAMHASGFLSLHYPAGSYKIAGTITTAAPTISITGDGPGVSRIEPTVFSGDVFRFTSTQVTRLLVDGISVRTVAGNKSNGATFAFTGTVTNALFNNLYLRHYYDAFRFDADINKCYFSWITLDQFGRTIETDANCSFNFVGKPVDVHMIGIQGSGFSGGSVDPNKINSHFKMGAVDGLYVMNSHFFYADQTVIFNPVGTDIASSCAFDQVYFDTCRLNHVSFIGTTTGAYQDMKFTSCVFRDATAGPSIYIEIANRTLDQLKFANCTFRDNSEGAIFDPHPYGNLRYLVVTGCTFDGNNYANSATSGDIVTRGDYANITGNTFIGGGAAGRAIYFFSTAQFNIVTSANLQQSTTAGIQNSGSGNEFHGIVGFKVKNKGFGTITTGNTSVTITHGLGFAPSETDIFVGYSSLATIPASANLYVNTITATQFNIVMTSAAAANVGVKWRAALW